MAKIYVLVSTQTETRRYYRQASGGSYVLVDNLDYATRFATAQEVSDMIDYLTALGAERDSLTCGVSITDQTA